MPTSVAGAIKLLDTTTPGTSSFVRFWLRGARGNEPRITATGAIAPQAAGSSFYVDIPADASGNVSGSIYSTRDSAGTGNGDIEAGGSYIAVWYGMQIYANSIPGPEIPVHAKQGATLVIQNITPITTPTVIASPTGDSTYARLDGGNSPFSGRIQQNGGDLVVSRTTTDTLTNKTLTAPVITSPAISAATLTGITQTARIRANQSSAVIAADFALGGNWGTSPSIGSIMGTDVAGAITVTAGSGSPGVNPTVTLTFHDGAWPATPNSMVSPGGNLAAGQFWAITGASTTTLTFTFTGTPSASIAYGLHWLNIG